MNLDQKKNLKNLEEEINIYEKNIILKNKLIITENFNECFNHYKLSINLLFEDPSYYLIIRNICLNDDYNQTDIDIWNSEHFDIITKYINFNSIIKRLIKNVFSLGIISIIQYKLLKHIQKKIINIWKTDMIFITIYNQKLNLPSKNEIKYFFDMVEIIYYKLLMINNKDLEETNPFEILNDQNYLKSITMIKKIFKNSFSQL